MAGIGFQLRRTLQRDTLSSTLAAYAYAGVVSAGPLLMSILGILLIGLLSLPVVQPPALIAQFQVSVTYLIAGSLITTGAVQLMFTRFVSDRLFERTADRILPAYNAVTLLTTVCTGLLAAALAFTVFAEQALGYRALMVMAFIILSNIWVSTSFLASTKRYAAILTAFFLGYALTVFGAVHMNQYGVEGLLAGFVAGHAVLLIILSGTIYHDHTSEVYLSWQMFQPRHAYPSLVLVGLLFNLGVWLDKFMFWFSFTGQDVIGPLRASVIYDIPVFIAYLCVIPGMAVFLLRLETDFVQRYDAFYAAIRKGGTLGQIRDMRDLMVRSARTALYEILKIQTIVVLLIFGFGDALLRFLGISTLYLPLLHVDVVATSLQVMFLGVLNIFFYLDRRRLVLGLTALFVTLNGVFTWMTLEIGPDAFGYGFAAALLLVVLLAVHVLNRSLENLEYETYMLQGS